MISPAKKMRIDDDFPEEVSLPLLLEQTEQIMEYLQSCLLYTSASCPALPDKKMPRPERLRFLYIILTWKKRLYNPWKHCL